MHLIEELSWRGLIQDISTGTTELLQKEVVKGYIGFDPTADSLHIGSLLPLLLLVHLQRSGHHPVAVVGGATGRIGDPSGKSAERTLLDETSLQHNLSSIRQQIEHILKQSGKPYTIVNNDEWFREMKFIDFARDIGKHITVNYMMAKESVKKRMEAGLSFTEFSYQLMQAYDFYYLFTHYDCKLQMGGADQWGNITTGIELIRKLTGKEAYAFTCPLLTRSDGSKFGKSESGENIWLDPQKTSPYQFYQFWINLADADAEKMIKIFTFLSQQEINELIQKHRAHPEERVLQKRLAEEITRFLHGEEGYEQAIQTTQKLFGKKDFSIPDESELKTMEGVERISIPFPDQDVELITLLAEKTSIFPSRGEVRRMIQNGGLYLNKQKVSDVTKIIHREDLLYGKYLLIQKGKKHHYLIEFK
ncbi:tyrosine--tRNA ligase [Thermoflavifilum thermophilum]|uniref:Tyrosine--tRNA ligase n=1 Tax=Thermoflavifilum thermophilum TaxID=1393122 RepID=A0A1I7NFH9_9BACT|nr:tyrosine--tRNA ligase [Thermoflavifilum thermophilum]SFV33408.1 tyrosyl-tRNA synthetase [Thermoflavifilum thermophilum]